MIFLEDNLMQCFKRKTSIYYNIWFYWIHFLHFLHFTQFSPLLKFNKKLGKSPTCLNDSSFDLPSVMFITCVVLVMFWPVIFKMIWWERFSTIALHLFIKLSSNLEALVLDFNVTCHIWLASHCFAFRAFYVRIVFGH